MVHPNALWVACQTFTSKSYCTSYSIVLGFCFKENKINFKIFAWPKNAQKLKQETARPVVVYVVSLLLQDNLQLWDISWICHVGFFFPVQSAGAPLSHQEASHCFESKRQSLRASLLHGWSCEDCIASLWILLDLGDSMMMFPFSLALLSLFICLCTPQPPQARVGTLAQCSALSLWKIFLLWSSERQALGWEVLFIYFFFKKERNKGRNSGDNPVWDGECWPLKKAESRQILLLWTHFDSKI